MSLVHMIHPKRDGAVCGRPFLTQRPLPIPRGQSPSTERSEPCASDNELRSNDQRLRKGPVLKNLKQRMDELGLTVEQLAENAGVSILELSETLRVHKRIPWTPDELCAIADALSCSSDYLVGRESRRVITEEEVGLAWDAHMQLRSQWDSLSPSSRENAVAFVNACHGSLVEPELSRDADYMHELHELTKRLRLRITELEQLVSPAEPERDLIAADARQLYAGVWGDGHDCVDWVGLPGDERCRLIAYANAARRYRPPTRAEKLRAAIALLGDDHPEAVAVLEEATRADG